MKQDDEVVFKGPNEKTPLLTSSFEESVKRTPPKVKPGLAEIFAPPTKPTNGLNPEILEQQLQKSLTKPKPEPTEKKPESEDEYTEEECTICAIMLGLTTPHKHRVLKKRKSTRSDPNRRFRSQVSVPSVSTTIRNPIPPLPRSSSFGDYSRSSPPAEPRNREVVRMVSLTSEETPRTLEEEIDSLRPSGTYEGKSGEDEDDAVQASLRKLKQKSEALQADKLVRNIEEELTSKIRKGDIDITPSSVQGTQAHGIGLSEETPGTSSTAIQLQLDSDSEEELSRIFSSGKEAIKKITDV